MMNKIRALTEREEARLKQEKMRRDEAEAERERMAQRQEAPDDEQEVDGPERVSALLEARASAVDCAIVGSDRIAANGDVANKIGTVAVALACREAGVPFVVAAPWSTVDLATASGEDIEIEVTSCAGVRVAPAGSEGFNPAFDVTPARMVSAIVTERGVVEPATGQRMIDEG